MGQPFIKRRPGKRGIGYRRGRKRYIENLHLGTYLVTEMQAPENLVCTGESKTVTLSYAGSTVEAATGSVTFTNARQKAAVSVAKQDNETKIHWMEAFTVCMPQMTSRMILAQLL